MLKNFLRKKSIFIVFIFLFCSVFGILVNQSLSALNNTYADGATRGITLCDPGPEYEADFSGENLTHSLEIPDEAYQYIVGAYYEYEYFPYIKTDFTDEYEIEYWSINRDVVVGEKTSKLDLPLGPIKLTKFKLLKTATTYATTRSLLT